MTTTREIRIEDMGTFEGALEYSLILADRWGKLKIPRDQQVLITDAVVVRGRLRAPGTAVAARRVDPDHGQLSVTDCTFVESTVADVAEILIDLAHEAVG